MGSLLRVYQQQEPDHLESLGPVRFPVHRFILPPTLIPNPRPDWDDAAGRLEVWPPPPAEAQVRLQLRMRSPQPLQSPLQTYSRRGKNPVSYARVT